jgi:hypothetical protein
MWSVNCVWNWKPVPLLCVIPLPLLSTVGALDMPFGGAWFVSTEGLWGPMLGVKFDLGG